MKRYILASVTLLLATTIAALVVEGVARSLFPLWAPRTGRVTEFWQYHPTYGWAHRPGYQGRFASHGFDTAVRINSHGFRGPEIGYHAHPGLPRVLVLGDSFVWGFGVEEEEMFTSVLSKRLSGEAELLNLGVSGYSTDQELLLYKEQGHRYRAQLVILVVAANDVADNARARAYVIYRKPLFAQRDDQLILTNYPVPRAHWLERAVFALAGRSYILNQLNRVREVWSLEDALAAQPGDLVPPPQRNFPATPAEKLTVRLILELRHTVQRNQSQFMVVLVDHMYGGRAFSDYLTAHSIDVVRLDDVMDGSDTTLHLVDDFHWNPAGHSMVADAIEPRIISGLRQWSSANAVR